MFSFLVMSGIGLDQDKPEAISECAAQDFHVASQGFVNKYIINKL